MPGSWGYLRPHTRDYLIKNFPPESTVLDIGAGDNTYHRLLGDYFTTMDAVEIWEPYVTAYKLRENYRNVYVMDIMDFEFDWYDIIIMGDTLEHLSAENGRILIERLAKKCKELVVIVPFNLPQDGIYDPGSESYCPYEAHLQPDLNFETMPERYPQLELLNMDPSWGMVDNKCHVIINAGEAVYYLCVYVKKQQ